MQDASWPCGSQCQESHREPPAAEVKLVPTRDIFWSLDEEWANGNAAARLHSWHMHHVSQSRTCIMTINTAQFQAPPPYRQLQDNPLTYDVITSYINIGYALRHNYDFLRVYMPSPNQLTRDLAWYKIPVLRYLAHLHYRYIMYVDADAFVQQVELPLHHAIPAFFQDASKVFFASLDYPGYSLMNAGVMLFRAQNTAFLSLLDEWWDAPLVYADDEKYNSRCKESGWPAEQGCLEIFLANGSDTSNVIAVGQEQWIYKDGEATLPTFVRHVTSLFTDEERTQVATSQAACDFVHTINQALVARQS